MTRVVLVTGDDLPIEPPDDPLLAAALVAEGVAVEVVSWRRDHRWAGADAAVVRSTWDIVDHIDDFGRWITRVAADVRLVADPEVLRWNLDKRYLLDLERRGVPIVPSVFAPAGTDVAGLAARRGWEAWLTKPVVGAGAIGIRRGRAGEPAVASVPVLVQPFLDGIADGEVSVVLVDGVAAHAVEKVPAAGDFRVQVEHGGTDRRIPLDPALRAAAERAVDAVGPVPVLARVDLVRGDDGGLLLMELELIEPQLFFDRAPETVPVAARALAAVARVAAGAHDDPTAVLLLAIRLRGRGTAPEVATTVARLTADPAAGFEDPLLDPGADEWIRRRGDPVRLSLRPAGEAALAARLAAVTEAVGRHELTEAYESFLALNRRFLGLVRTHESGVDARGPLAELVEELQPVLDALRERLARFEGYRGRFARAVGRAAVDPDWVASPRLDSIHTVWFELHEHLLATLGRDRTQER